ncbi:MAG: C-terminal binding protein [Planctomycetaceae bacterium]|nr:C-terminal binding protein [Planctomycetaceae bacterium]
MSWRVLLTDRAWPDSSVEQRELAAVGAELIEAPDGSEATLTKWAADVDAIMTCWAPVTEAIVRAATKCRHIARMGIGLDNIAVSAATERRIRVTNVPDYCVEEVADHALALLLACARKVAFFHQRTKAGEYRLQAGSPLRRLRGAVLGIVGMGRIARAVAERARVFGFEIIAWTRSGNDHGSGARMVDLPELLRLSDFVSLNVPLTAETRHMLNRGSLALLKPSAFVINTSRGGLIDHTALWDALQAGRLAGAALDVFDPEPPDLSQPLVRDERVIVTPHTAFVSAESLQELRLRAARQVAATLTGNIPENVVNPQVDGNR